MNVPTNLFMWIMACLPIIVLLLLLIKFQWGATEAAPIGLLITIITAVAFYKADFTLLASETAKGIWSALPILLIVWTAILLYQVADEAKAFLVIRNGMRKLLPNELLLVLALGWILESFLQGITGFGVPVAVGAPLLIGIGMHPMWAVILPLLGQSWGNTFGTLAAAWDSLASTSGLTTGSPEYFAAALWASAFLFVWDVITGLIMCWFYGKGAGVKKGLPAVLILAVIQGGGELLLRPGKHYAFLLYPVLRIPGGIIPDRKNEDVPRGVETGRQPDHEPGRNHCQRRRGSAPICPFFRHLFPTLS